MKKCYEVPEFFALQAESTRFHSDEKLHLRNLCADSSRCDGLVATHFADGFARKIIFDYSRQQVTGETVELLFSLADKVGLLHKRKAMRCGAKINMTEGRPVLHHALRIPKNYDYSKFNPDGTSIMEDVHAVREQIATFSENIRNGTFVGVTGKALKHFVCIGIGGSQLGPEFVAEALQVDATACQASQGHTLRFLANVDPVAFELCMRDLHPEETLLIVISKTFTTVETMLNARACKQWLLDTLMVHEEREEQDITSKHIVAVSTSTDKCIEFGIDETNIFAFWPWVGGRFSVCSAVGLLPLSLQYSYDVMCAFLEGAHDMDEHFFTAPLRDNLPVLLGLLGIWNSTFLRYGTRALLPYSQALKRFPSHIQQLDMESNGKRVAMDGSILPFPCGEIIFGEPGTNGQHSFYQLLHQGRVVPVEFIGFMESQVVDKTPVNSDTDSGNDTTAAAKAVSHHDELMSNFFAQPDALAYGKTLTDLEQEGVPVELRPHKVFPGNRPSSSLLLTKLDAFAVGQLLAMYEHRAAVQGFVWGLNSFDQWGVELGKVLGKRVKAQLVSSRKGGAPVQGFNSSTSALLLAYLRHGKSPK